MHTISIGLDDSIYERPREFLKFYPSNRLCIIEDDDDTKFTKAKAKTYKEAIGDLEKKYAQLERVCKG